MTSIEKIKEQATLILGDVIDVEDILGDDCTCDLSVGMDNCDGCRVKRKLENIKGRLRKIRDEK